MAFETLLHAFVWLAACFLADRTYVSERFGFRVDRPSDDWAFYAADQEGSALTVVSFYPRGTHGVPSFVVYVYARPPGASLATIVDAQYKKLADRVARDLARGEMRIAGADASWIGGVIADETLGEYRVQYTFLGSERYVYTLQRAEHLENEAEHRDLDALVSTFATFAAKEEPADPEAEKLVALAARCGSEIEWCATWDAAAARAKKEEKLVLVVYESYEGLGLPSTLPSGPFMDPDLVALVNERFVVWRMGKTDEAPFRKPDAFGIGPHAWGTAFLFADASGKLVRETSVTDASYLAEIMRKTLADHAPRGDRTETKNQDKLAEAEKCLRRGDLERADKLLADVTTARGHQLRAALYRAQRKGKEALAELAAARRVADDKTSIDVVFDEAVVLMRMARYEEAEQEFERALKKDEHSSRAPEALFWLGAFEVLRKGLDSGSVRWRTLAESYPENRWAWKAAANLTKEGRFINGGERLDWPEPELIAAVVHPRAEPLDATKLERVEREAVAYLVKSQRADGTWINPEDAFGVGTGLYTPAISAIAAASLIPFAAQKEASAAVKTAIAHVLELTRGGKLEAGEGITGAYSIWGRTCALWFFARCKEARIGDEHELAGAMGELVQSIVKSQHKGGGWPYVFLPGDPAGEGFDPSASFLTSGVLFTLLEARANGATVPRESIEKGVRFLERMRQPDGSFRYMPELPNAIVDGAAPEAAGRGPLCALALQRGSAALERESDRSARSPREPDRKSKTTDASAVEKVEIVRVALRAFVENHGGFKREWHKELCHTAPEGFGSHYIFYDYLFAAAAVRSLPREERGRYRTVILGDVLDARFADGSFEDMPFLGRAYATAMALMTLRELRTE